jgi:uncharacterized OsmC-like protein
MTTITTTVSTGTPAPGDAPAPAVAEPNGVPVDKLFATREKMRAQPELAAFRFTARNRWVEGTASASTMREWYGAGADHDHVEEFTATADHPTLGHGHGPTPQEYVLHALAACLTAGIATGAAARGITLESVESVVRGEIDVRGVLGVDHDVRKGFSDIRCELTVRGDADPAQLEALIDSSRKGSAVYDMLTNPTPVEVGAA